MQWKLRLNRISLFQANVHHNAAIFHCSIGGSVSLGFVDVASHLSLYLLHSLLRFTEDVGCSLMFCFALYPLHFRIVNLKKKTSTSGGDDMTFSRCSTRLC